jgi:hypothetical protein
MDLAKGDGVRDTYGTTFTGILYGSRFGARALTEELRRDGALLQSCGANSRMDGVLGVELLPLDRKELCV